MRWSTFLKRLDSMFRPPRRGERTDDFDSDIDEFVVKELRPPGPRNLESWYRAQDLGDWYDKEERIVAFLKAQVEAGRRAEVVGSIRGWLRDPPSLQLEVERPISNDKHLSRAWHLAARWIAWLELHELGPDLEACARSAQVRFEDRSVAEHVSKLLDGVARGLIPEEELEPTTQDEELLAMLQWREPRRKRKPRVN